MLPGNGSGLGSSLHKPQGEMAHSCELLHSARDPGPTREILIFGPAEPAGGTCKPCTRELTLR